MKINGKEIGYSLELSLAPPLTQWKATQLTNLLVDLQTRVSMQCFKFKPHICPQYQYIAYLFCR